MPTSLDQRRQELLNIAAGGSGGTGSTNITVLQQRRQQLQTQAKQTIQTSKTPTPAQQPNIVQSVIQKLTKPQQKQPEYVDIGKTQIKFVQPKVAGVTGNQLEERRVALQKAESVKTNPVTNQPTGTVLKTAPKKTVWDDIVGFVHGITPTPAVKPGGEKGKITPTVTQDIVAYGVKRDLKTKDSLVKVRAGGGSFIKETDTEQKAKEYLDKLGIPRQRTNTEAFDAVMALAIAYAAITNPVAAAYEIGKYTALATALQKGLKATTGKEHVSELLPDSTPGGVLGVVDALEFIGTGFASHKIKPTKITKPVTDLITRKTIESNNLPTRLYLDPKEVQSTIKGTGSQQLAQDLGIKYEDFRKAVRGGTQGGVQIEVPSSKVVQITDRPYWAKIKSLFRLEPTSETSTIISGKPEFTPIAGLIGDGTYKPAELRNKIFVEGLQNTEEGKQLLKATLDAEQAGQEIQVGGEKPVEVRTPKQLQELAQQSRDEHGSTYGFNNFVNNLTPKEKEALTPEKVQEIFRSTKDNKPPSDVVEAKPALQEEKPKSIFTPDQVSLRDEVSRLYHDGDVTGSYKLADTYSQAVGAKKLSEFPVGSKVQDIWDEKIYIVSDKSPNGVKEGEFSLQAASAQDTRWVAASVPQEGTVEKSQGTEKPVPSEKVDKPTETQTTQKSVSSELTRKELEDKIDSLTPVPYSEEAFKKLASAQRGITADDTRPALIYGGLQKHVYTDGYILVLDKEAADALNQVLLDKQRKKLLKELGDEKAVEATIKKNLADNKDTFPRYAQILPNDLTPYKEGFPQAFSTANILLYSDGKQQYALNYQFVAVMRKYLPEDRIYFNTENQNAPAIVSKDGETIDGLIMPITMRGISQDLQTQVKPTDNMPEGFKAAEEKPKKEEPPLLTEKEHSVTRAGAGADVVPKKTAKPSNKSLASIEPFAQLENLSNGDTKALSFPEMVDLARELLQKYPVVKRPRSRAIGIPNGVFMVNGLGETKLMLNPDLFAPDPARVTELVGKMSDRKLVEFEDDEGLVGEEAFEALRDIMPDIEKAALEQAREEAIEQAGKTLSHEIGHVVDWLPDKTLARGNILGHLATLQKFMFATFTDHATEERLNILRNTKKSLIAQRQANRTEKVDPDTGKKTFTVIDKKLDSSLLKELKAVNKNIKSLQKNAIKNKDVRRELWDLSSKWRPIPEDAEESFIAYRNENTELYADAISVLLNDPVRLKLEAPIFYDGFFKFLDQKPEVKEAYFALQDLLHQPEEKLQQKRLAKLYEGFNEAVAKRKEISEKVRPQRAWKERFMHQHVTRFDPIYRKVDKKLDSLAIELSPSQTVRMQMEEMQMRRNETFLYLNKMDRDVVKPLEALGMNEQDLGIMLTLERNLAGRRDIANPYGLQGQFSEKSLEYFQKHLQETKGVTPEQFNILQQAARKFREETFKIVTNAAESELYSKKFYNETALPNKDTYATYQVIEYIHDNYVSAGIKHAIGTLKPIENPFISTVLKNISVIEQTEIQKGKLSVIKEMRENFPEDISDSIAIRPKGVRIGWRPVENRKALEYYKDGKKAAVDVDPYIAQMFDLYTGTELHNIAKVSQQFNRFFKPVVTTYNVSWGFYSNIIRDAKRTYKNIATILPVVAKGQKNITLREFITTYIKAIPTAKNYQDNKITPKLEKMLEDKAFSTSFTAFDPIYEETSLAPIMKKYGFLSSLNDKSAAQKIVQSKFVSPVTKILEGIEYAGSTLETTSKVAGYQMLEKRLQNGKLAGFLTRNYVGTPNYIDGGTQKQIDNSVFVFSNVMIQAVRADAMLATSPKTRAGYWYRTFMVDLLPKLVMLAGAAGLFGAYVKDIFDKATEYDKTNYLIVPLGVEKDGKGVYWRIPQDETGRFFSAMVWKLGTFATGQLTKPEQILALGAGYLPSLTPLWQIGGGWINYVQGRNPYDDYRGRFVVDDLTWKAGGLPAFTKMIQWTTNSLGLSQFTTYADENNTTLDWILKLTPVVNRAVRSSDFGLTEKENVVKAQEESKNAQKTLKTREMLQKAVDETRKHPEKRAEIEKQLYKDVVGGKIKDSNDKRTVTNTRKKFQLALKKGHVSRELDSLIDATDNDFKIQLFKQYKKSLSPEEYKKLRAEALQLRIVSDELRRMMAKEKL